MELLNDIFNLCIVPLLGILTAYLVKMISVKSEELKQRYNNEFFWKYTDLLENTIKDCVIATNQTYVDALKDKNAFDEEAQKIAYKKTFNNVINILGSKTMNILNEMYYSDLPLFIESKIEKYVNDSKHNKIA